MTYKNIVINNKWKNIFFYNFPKHKPFSFHLSSNSWNRIFKRIKQIFVLRKKREERALKLLIYKKFISFIKKAFIAIFTSLWFIADEVRVGFFFLLFKLCWWMKLILQKMENFIYLGLNIRVKNIILFISFNKFLYDFK